jgi:raffinose/stachyose/melibiose transport system substrate-binding protein
VLFGVEATELAAGNGPDLVSVFPGCGFSVSMCVLGKEGDLMPLVRAPWTKRSLPQVVSASKWGSVLYAFDPGVAVMGMFTNDALFGRLRLPVPRSFPQLLALCEKAKADGTVAVLFPGADQAGLEWLVTDLAVSSVYANDKHWTAELKSGSVSFAGSAGWQEALHEFVEMNSAGCFEPGVTGYSTPASIAALFAQGQGLMMPTVSSGEGLIAAANPGFKFSFVPFPNGDSPSSTTMFLNLGASVGVNAHASPANQVAAEAFINFLARPAQNELYARLAGVVTQEKFLKRLLPSFMSSMAPLVQNDAYVVNPATYWWNSSVQTALEQQTEGLLTGQTTTNDVLNAMDAAWKQGPG